MHVAVFLSLLSGLLGLFVVAVIKAFRRKSFSWIATAVLLALLIPGMIVGRLASNAANIQHAAKTLVSADGRFAFTVQGEWQPRWGHYPEGCIQAADPINGRYAVLISDAKDATVGILEQYGGTKAKHLADTFTDVHLGSGVRMQVAGFDAIQHRIEGRRNNQDVVFFHTAIDAGTSYCQILCWCTDSDEEAAIPVFEKLVSSLELRQK